MNHNGASKISKLNGKGDKSIEKVKKRKKRHRILGETPSPADKKKTRIANSPDSLPSDLSEDSSDVDSTCGPLDLDMESDSIQTQKSPLSESHSDSSLTNKTWFCNALKDPEVRDLIKSIFKEAESERIGNLESQVQSLQAEVKKKDEVILQLTDRLDDLEQYGRRTNLRLSGIQETPGENTDSIVIDIATKIGIPLSINDISRSHRVGPRASPSGAPRARPIIFRLNSYRVRDKLFRARSKLKSITFGSQPRANSGNSGVFINEDLTKIRALIAWRARKLVHIRKLKDTWSFDGVIFVKYPDDKVERITSQTQMSALEISFRSTIDTD